MTLLQRKQGGRKGKLFFLVGVLGMLSCNPTGSETHKDYPIDLITLAPGHFHAALVQKVSYPEVSPNVHVYAPKGKELDSHLALIDQYNAQADDPTSWKEIVYEGDDYLEQMLSDKKGNMVVLAGNNRHKIDYLVKSVDAGMNVLSDKPVIIHSKDFPKLEQAFITAREQGVLVYDIMTERYEVNTMLQRDFSQQQELFGSLVNGSEQEPAITKESVHHFFKEVSGNPLVRPDWFYDTQQQGEGIVDVTTHLVDLVQWESFPDQKLDYLKDIELVSSKRWPTMLSKEQFQKSTSSDQYPGFLEDAVDQNGDLKVYANGEINFKIKGVHAQVSVIWNFQAPEGAGDTHYSIMRGEKANLIIRQGEEEGFKPVLYVESTGVLTDAEFGEALQGAVDGLSSKYAGLGIELQKEGSYKVFFDPSINTTHEEHFGEVTQKYLGFITGEKEVPNWEIPNMLAKYYLTTKALDEAETVDKP